MTDYDASTQSCPLPLNQYNHITMAHGSGGQLSQDLIQSVFLSRFDGKILAAREDQAIVPARTERIAITCDSFVVNPLFFPGGDIGKLAIYGTINDLAVGGARPLYIAAAFILEEGLPIDLLHQVAASMHQACMTAGVELVAGDTKVVERGKGDKIFIATTGIGSVAHGLSLSISKAQPGDRIILSGTMGDHGIAIMSLREGLEFESTIASDCAPLHELARIVLEVCPQVRCMRDATRGGVAAVLNELAQASRVAVVIDEARLPVKPQVRGACEILGLDPLYIANEGKLIAVAPAETADELVAALRCHPLGVDATMIGTVREAPSGQVALKTGSGYERTLLMPAGEPLPRIC